MDSSIHDKGEPIGSHVNKMEGFHEDISNSPVMSAQQVFTMVPSLVGFDEQQKSLLRPESGSVTPKNFEKTIVTTQKGS